MFLLSFVPDALIQLVVNAVLITGAIGFAVSFFFGFFARFMPWILPYRMFLQVISIILLIAGVYFKGGIGVEMEWREKVRQAEEKVKIAEQRAEEASKKVQVKIVEKIKVVKEKEIVVQEKIKEVEKVVDAKCEVAPEAINILNDAAKLPWVK